MTASLTTDVLDDDVAVLLARVLAAANKCARESGLDVAQFLITITQTAGNSPRWQVNYGPKDYIGQRGGDLIVEVDPSDVSIKRVLQGQ